MRYARYQLHVFPTSSVWDTRCLVTVTCDIALDRPLSRVVKTPERTIFCRGRPCSKMQTVCRGVFLFVFVFACEDFERMFDHSFPACAFFFFFLKWKLGRAHLIPLFMPRSVHSGPGHLRHLLMSLQINWMEKCLLVFFCVCVF